MKKKLLSIVLILSMLCTFVPVVSNAAESDKTKLLDYLMDIDMVNDKNIPTENRDDGESDILTDAPSAAEGEIELTELDYSYYSNYYKLQTFLIQNGNYLYEYDSYTILEKINDNSDVYFDFANSRDSIGLIYTIDFGSYMIQSTVILHEYSEPTGQVLLTPDIGQEQYVGGEFSPTTHRFYKTYSKNVPSSSEQIAISAFENGLAYIDTYLKILKTGVTLSGFHIAYSSVNQPIPTPTLTPTPVPVYTVSYDANGGGGAPSSQTAKSGDSIIISSQVPTRKGYDFLGWSTSKTALTADYMGGNSMRVTANTTLYAVWEKIPMPDTTGNKINISNAQITGNTISFNVNLQTSNELQGTLLIAIYDTSGALVDAEQYPAEAKKSISFEKRDNYDSAKILWWYDTESMYPMAEYAEVDLTDMPSISYTFDKGVIVINSTGRMVDFESAANSPFYGRADITEVIVNDTVTTIGSYSFEKCGNLKTITMSPSVNSIGYGAFSGCGSLTDIYFTGSEEEWGAITVDDYNTPFTNANVHFIYSITNEYDNTRGSVKITDNGSEVTAAPDGDTIQLEILPDSGLMVRSVTVTDENGNNITVEDNTFTMPKSNVHVKVIFDTAYKITTEYDNTLGTVTVMSLGEEAELAVSGTLITVNITPKRGCAVTLVEITDKNGGKIDITDNTFIMPDSDVHIKVIFAEQYTIKKLFDSPRGNVTTTVAGFEVTQTSAGEVVTVNILPKDGYAIRVFEVTDAVGNRIDLDGYDFVMPESDVTVKVVFDPGCVITKEYDSSKGSVSAITDGLSVNEAITGANISVMVTPHDGYGIRSVDITDAVGHKVELTNGSFTMPNSSVNIKVEFDTAYAINIDYNDLGTVEAYSAGFKTKAAVPGNTVEIAANPNPNCTIDDIKVSAANGNPIDINDNTFIMPDSGVTISVLFGNIIDSGKCGDNTTYRLTDNGILIISGEGAFYNGNYSSFSGDIKKVIIEQGVTSIGYSAFNGCSGLTSITIPDSVTSIDGYAFYGCEGLTNITIPDSVTSIGSNTFSCSGLTSVTIPDSVTSIGEYAFSDCSGLTSITIGSGVTSIGYNTFYGCSSLKDVHITDVSKWCGIGFDGSSSNPLYYADNLYVNDVLTTDLIIPNGVTSIGNYAFYGCSGLTSVTIPNSVTSIGNYAFGECNNLADVYYNGKFEDLIKIPGCENSSIFHDATVHCTDITLLGWGAFGNTVTWVLDDSGMLTISGEGDFYHTNTDYSIFKADIKKVIIEQGITNIYGGAFAGCSCLTSIAIPDSVTSIGESAFSGCSSLTSITIPDSVKNIYQRAFSGCDSLEDVHITDIAKWCEINFSYDDSNPFCYAKNLYVNDVLTTDLAIPNGVTTISDYAFYGCSGLTSVTIPNGVTSIGSNAFYGCSGLTSVAIGSGVASIGNYAFYGCSGLTSVAIGSGVASIGNYAFYGCSNLKDVYYNGKFEDLIKIPGCGYSGNFCSATVHCTDITLLGWGTCGNTVNWVLDDEGTLTISGEGEVSRNGNYRSFSEDIKKVIIEQGVTSIGEHAFIDCSNFTSVTIPDSVTSIGEYAFRDCDSLTSVTIPDSVTSIGEHAFYACDGLTSVTIGSGVTNIGKDAFLSCRSLTDVYYNGKFEDFIKISGCEDSHKFYDVAVHCTDVIRLAWGKCGDNVNWVFDNNNTLIISGEGEMDDYIWYSLSWWHEIWSDAKNVIIAGGVTNIGEDVFRNCDSLTNVTIPDSVTSIGNNAFSGCNGLTSVTIPDSVTSIGESAFSSCSSLTSITIGSGVTSIGSNAFSGCSSLTSVTIPDSVTSIGEYAFSGCRSLTSITIGSGVTSIGSNAFSGCSLDSVYISSLAAYLNIEFSSSDSNPMYYAHNLYLNGNRISGALEIPNGVTKIPDYAFYGCGDITSVVIPDSVTSIGSCAFYGCSRLTTVLYRGSSDKWDSINIGSGNDCLKDANIEFDYIG